MIAGSVSPVKRVKRDVYMKDSVEMVSVFDTHAAPLDDLIRSAKPQCLLSCAQQANAVLHQKQLTCVAGTLENMLESSSTIVLRYHLKTSWRPLSMTLLGYSRI